MSKLGDTYEALSVASSNGGDVDDLVFLFNSLVSQVNSGTYDPADVENQLDIIMDQASRVNEQALIESRNELFSVALTVLIVVIIEYYLWRGFPKLYWSEWLKRRGDWQVK